MRNKHLLFFSALFVVAVTTQLIFWYTPRNITRDIKTDAGSSDSSSQAAKQSNAPALELPPSKRDSSLKPLPAPTRVLPLGSLPALDKPLAPQIPVLEEQARNGDSSAAVNLWNGLQQCAGLTNGNAEANLNLAKKGYDNDKNAQPPDYARQIRDLLENCANVTGPQMMKRYDFLKTAAEQGDSRAQYLYAHAGTEAIGGDMEALRDPKKWEEYRDTAISYRESLARQCSIDAIADLASSYYFGDAYFSPDITKAYMFRTLSTRLTNLPEKPTREYLDQLSSKMSSDQINQAKELANQFYGKYCN